MAETPAPPTMADALFDAAALWSLAPPDPASDPAHMHIDHDAVAQAMFRLLADTGGPA